MIKISEAVLNEALRGTICQGRPDYIIEVGSYNGETLRHYKDSSPYSIAIGFEASPTNYFKYCIGKGVQHMAVSDHVGTVDIYEPVERKQKSTSTFRKERVTSIKKVVDGKSFNVYNVLSTTLDSFFAREIEDNKTFALIIDAEGTTFEVLAGAERLLERTMLLKVEVEDIVSWEKQYTVKQVSNLIGDRFRMVGHNKIENNQKQHNRYYVGYNYNELADFFLATAGEY